MEESKEALVELFIERHLAGEVRSLDDFIRDHPELESLDPGERERIESLLAYMDDPSEAPALEDEALPEVPGYRLLERRGAGSYGVVYRALDETLNREVALKLILPGIGQERLRKFLAEARMLASAEHENVVSIYSVGEQPEFLCMEWIEGVDLAEYLRERRYQPTTEILGIARQLARALHSEPSEQRYLPTIEALGIARQLARALHCVHEQGLVHRDVKPSNVMVTRGGAVKLMDFGIARIGGENSDVSRHAIIGTPRYMAPEQVLGEGVDARSDLFSFGIVLYELLTGRRPFADDSLEELQNAIVHDAPASLLEYRQDLSPAVVDLVEKLLLKDPERRPQSAAEVESAISRIMVGEDEPASPREKSLHSTSRRWTHWFAAAVAVVVVLGGVWRLWPALREGGDSALGSTAGLVVLEARLVVLSDEYPPREVLDGERLPAGSKLRFEWCANHPAYVYAWTVTESKEKVVLFPDWRYLLKNPVPPGEVVLPGFLLSKADDGVWTLDSSTGPQHVFFEASLERIPEIEEAMALMTDLKESDGSGESVRSRDNFLVLRGMTKLSTHSEAHAHLAQGSSVSSLVRTKEGVWWHREFEVK